MCKQFPDVILEKQTPVQEPTPASTQQPTPEPEPINAPTPEPTGLQVSLNHRSTFPLAMK